jgi:carboxypeptidase C (cathepsin A)
MRNSVVPHSNNNDVISTGCAASKQRASCTATKAAAVSSHVVDSATSMHAAIGGTTSGLAKAVHYAPASYAHPSLSLLRFQKLGSLEIFLRLHGEPEEENTDHTDEDTTQTGAPVVGATTAASSATVVPPVWVESTDETMAEAHAERTFTAVEAYEVGHVDAEQAAAAVAELAATAAAPTSAMCDPLDEPAKDELNA